MKFPPYFYQPNQTTLVVVIISYRTIREFAHKHKTVEDQLNNWYTITEKCD
jgi:hypothetical protein